MTSDRLTAEQRSEAGPYLAGQSCGYGGSVDIAPSEPWQAPGRYFPATAHHKYGRTTVTQESKRVVVVGLREQDPCWPSASLPWPRRSGTARTPARWSRGRGPS